MVFENRVLGRIFGPRKDDVRREWRKPQNAFNDLYSSPNIVRVMKTENNKKGGPCSMYGGAEAYTGFWCGNLR